MVLAVMVLLVLSALPHHHHGDGICMAMEKCDDESPCHADDEECVGKSVFIAERGVDLQDITIQNITGAAMLLPPDEVTVAAIERMAIPSVDKEPPVPNNAIGGAIGLRAPPTV